MFAALGVNACLTDLDGYSFAPRDGGAGTTPSTGGRQVSGASGGAIGSSGGSGGHTGGTGGAQTNGGAGASMPGTTGGGPSDGGSPSTGGFQNTGGVQAGGSGGFATGGVTGGAGAGGSETGGASTGGAGAGGGATGPPSCQGLPSTCGPSKAESCCASPVVMGGNYYRYYDGVTTQPINFTNKTRLASVSTFRLDRFEVTVGRFRNFVAAWNLGWRPSPGSGKHTHVNGGAGLYDVYNTANEPGWLASWTAGINLLSDQSSCFPLTWTFSPGANENRPMSCVSWYEAYAFCIWDGGFLPSGTELTYAAQGGAEQRVYPWSNPPTATAVDCTLANYATSGTTPCTGSAVDVGTFSPAGDGFYGQADLAGNLREWALDSDFSNFYGVDQTYLQDGNARAHHGGGFYDTPDVLIGAWLASSGTRGDEQIGVRCARSP